MVALMHRTLLLAGAMSLVLIPPAYAVAVDPQPLIEWGIEVIVLPVVTALVAWGIAEFRRRTGLEKKSQAILILERIADNALAAGAEKLHTYAKVPKVEIANPKVAALAGYVIHQGPQAMRDAGMSEDQVAAWMSTKLGIEGRV